MILETFSGDLLAAHLAQQREALGASDEAQCSEQIERLARYQTVRNAHDGRKCFQYVYDSR
jgi:hypothetical protein